MTPLIGDASKARIIAFIIDNLLACLVSFLIVGAIHSENPIVSGTTLGVAYLAYFFCFELFWSRTPGKFLQGLVVRDINGGRCSGKQILLRTAARLLEANPFLFGGIPAGIAVFASAHKQRMGDSLAGTVVVSRQAVLSAPTDAA
jgi:uncharacterized RDD family membrane protein YckC